MPGDSHFDGGILYLGVDHGRADHLMSEELLDAGDVHASIQQARGAHIAQAMGIKWGDLQGLADCGQMVFQPGIRHGFAVGVRSHRGLTGRQRWWNSMKQAPSPCPALAGVLYSIIKPFPLIHHLHAHYGRNFSNPSRRRRNLEQDSY